MEDLIIQICPQGQTLNKMSKPNTGIYDGQYHKSHFHLEVPNGDVNQASLDLDNWHFEGLDRTHIRVEPPFGGSFVLSPQLIEGLVWIIAR